MSSSRMVKTSFDVIFSMTVTPICEGDVSFALAAARACAASLRLRIDLLLCLSASAGVMVCLLAVPNADERRPRVPLLRFPWLGVDAWAGPPPRGASFDGSATRTLAGRAPVTDGAWPPQARAEAGASPCWVAARWSCARLRSARAFRSARAWSFLVTCCLCCSCSSRAFSATSSSFAASSATPNALARKCHTPPRVWLRMMTACTYRCSALTALITRVSRAESALTREMRARCPAGSRRRSSARRCRCRPCRVARSPR